MAPRHLSSRAPKSNAKPRKDHTPQASTSTNASSRGYAARQERKRALDVEDAYDLGADGNGFARKKNRRAGVALELSRDDAAAAGSGSDGDESEAGEGGVGLDADLRAKIARRMQEDTVASEDDEEIESDDAFDEGDKERYGGYSFASDNKAPPKSKQKGKEKQLPKINLDESDEEGAEQDSSDGEEQDQGEEDLYDPLAMLEGRKPAPAGDDDMDQDSEDGIDGDEDGEEDESESEDEEAEVELVSDEDAAMDEDALESLGQFVQNLQQPPSLKRKARDDIDGDVETTGAMPPPKRRLLKERTEAGVEGEFSVRTSGNGMLKLDDLLAPLSAATASDLKASTKALKASGKAGPLSAPLPTRTQDRIDRVAAYEQTKQEVDKWKITMKQIKQAEHLSFPLQPAAKTGTSTLQLAASFIPTTDLESAVDKLLRTAGLRDQDIAKTEALQTNHLSVEEVASRRAELLRTRELMFRADAKAKRVAKIKSKAFRRIRKKQREKDAAVNGLLDDGDDDGAEGSDAERMEAELARARERATLRHKNTGKWAKAMLARDELDADQRRDINEMLAKGEKLRRRVQGVGSGSDSGGDEDDADDSDASIAQIKRDAFNELARLEEEAGEEANANGVDGKKLKGVYQMKFMTDGMARRKHEADQMMEGLRDELTKVNSDSDSDVSEGTQRANGDVVSDRVNGRMVFAPGNPIVRHSTINSNATASDISTVDGAAPPTLTSSPGAGTSTLPASSPANPWLNDSCATTLSGKVSRKKNEVVVAKGSNAADKAAHALSKKSAKAGAERNKARVEDEATVEISVDEVLKLKPAEAGMDGDDDDDEGGRNSEVEEQERMERAKGLKGKGKAKAIATTVFQQRELVALAFAGDNVVEEFAAAKRQEIEADAPKVEDMTLTGWGSWGGRGTKKQKPKPHLLKTIPGIDPTQRADHGKAHVIISEKTDKKAQKYRTKDLPFPYTGRAQFERTLEMPLGQEWNTRVGFQRATMPRVFKKMGTVITPVRKNL